MISVVSTSIASTPLVGFASLIVVLLLLSFLIQKEIATASGNVRLQKLSKALNIVIIPLLFVFILIAISRMVEVLN